jgi:hypothetical protein
MARGAAQPPKRPCNDCASHQSTLANQTIACSKSGCEGQFPWPVSAQLEAWVRAGRPETVEPPRGLCGTCRQAMQQRSDQDVPCRLRGCTGKWSWSAAAQITAAEGSMEDPTPPKRLCDECEAQLRSLADQPVQCRVRGCTQTWVWTRWNQLEGLRAAKPGAPAKEGAPARMCERCVGRAAALKDEERPCRVRGCKNTWLFSARAQLEAELAGETSPKRMCNACLDKFAALEDREMPCKRSGCKNTWTWKRGAQLAGKQKRAPIRFCTKCEGELDKLSDKQVPCEHDGCKNTWTWTRAQQLASGTKKPPKHMCSECQSYLEQVQPKDIPCMRCGKAIHWSKHNQLLTKLGRWVEPTVCGTCKQGGTAAQTG